MCTFTHESTVQKTKTERLKVSIWYDQLLRSLILYFSTFRIFYNDTMPRYATFSANSFGNHLVGANVSFVICFIDLVEEMGSNYMRMHQ